MSDTFDFLCAAVLAFGIGVGIVRMVKLLRLTRRRKRRVTIYFLPIIEERFDGSELAVMTRRNPIVWETRLDCREIMKHLPPIGSTRRSVRTIDGFEVASWYIQ